MKLTEIQEQDSWDWDNPEDEQKNWQPGWEEWDTDMDINSGLGRLWHKIRAEASYSHKGPFGREIPINELAWSKSEVDKHFGGQEGLFSLLGELENRGKISINRNNNTITIAPDIVSRDEENQMQMNRRLQRRRGR
jgi:hypothetical protein